VIAIFATVHNLPRQRRRAEHGKIEIGLIPETDLTGIDPAERSQVIADAYRLAANEILSHATRGFTINLPDGCATFIPSLLFVMADLGELPRCAGMLCRRYASCRPTDCACLFCMRNAKQAFSPSGCATAFLDDGWDKMRTLGEIAVAKRRLVVAEELATQAGGRWKAHLREVKEHVRQLGVSPHTMRFFIDGDFDPPPPFPLTHPLTYTRSSFICLHPRLDSVR